jgi:hypothetical protein
MLGGCSGRCSGRGVICLGSSLDFLNGVISKSVGVSSEDLDLETGASEDCDFEKGARMRLPAKTEVYAGTAREPSPTLSSRGNVTMKGDYNERSISRACVAIVNVALLAIVSVLWPVSSLRADESDARGAHSRGADSHGAQGLQEASGSQVSHGSKGETIVLIRHGEKTAQELGQLSCRGLNRALALPDVLIKRYGRADYIYAPNPSVEVQKGNGPLRSYVRPLATIEPTAIRLGLPVNTQIGFNDIETLQKELMQPAYANALIFVAWEHEYLYKFARQMLVSGGKNPDTVQEWPGNDYDTIYIFHVVQSNGSREISFKTEHEKLDHLSDACPAIH